MSKKIHGSIPCPKCNGRFEVTLYRSVWIEDPSMRQLVFSNRINVVTCSLCGYSGVVPTSLLATNVQRGFAVWYEPYPDPDVDADQRGYAQHFGADSFYATAPRIASWEEFKETICKFERGELVGRPPTLRNPMTTRAAPGQTTSDRPVKTSSGGCLLFLVSSFIAVGAVGLVLWILP